MNDDEMGFDRDGITSIGLGVGPAVGMAFMEELGIIDMIDDMCTWDRKQRLLSPGKAAKAIVGTMLTGNNKKAMRNVALFYSKAPVDRLFGSEIDLRSLNDQALGRNLSTIFEADTDRLLYSIASRVKAELHLCSNVFHIDPSNITIARTAGDEYTDLPEGAPEPKLGRPKDGTKDRVQYNFCAAVDDDGIPVYMRAYDGNKDDTLMVSEAVKFVETMMEDSRIVAVGDGKMVTRDLVAHMCENETRFISKPPEAFAYNVAAKVAEAALAEGFTVVGRIGIRNDSPEFEVYDTDFECYGIGLRFVAYRKMDRSKYIRHKKRLDKHHVDETVRSFTQKSFRTLEEAEAARKNAVDRFLDSAWKLNATIRSRNGRDGTEWKVSFKPFFDEALAQRIADRIVDVIVTNIPRREQTCDDLSQGATARDILAAYCGQWRVEGLFSEMKSGLGADNVFFQKPSHEAAMLFLLTVGAMVRRVIMTKLRNEYGKGFDIPENITASRFFTLVQNVDVILDPDVRRISLLGSDEDRAQALSFIDALGINPVKLLG